ncbi:flavodoxin family protein [Fusobacterium nucleatum subsp. nucleatum ATCC 23726]|uniref:Iron-sulfur protein n=1 Tax=Fusobacterium nucleatum subsp. nucleatum (strain ATCC 23726 / VPI 4351) TaxID=525283 RepID=D5RAD5_FUSN2|nr:flavodoxin family protein [Fusobacterium nucleatum]ALF25492.1 iron-sulfur protein [Fusobacterium nucleatum subsp. nucleatum]AVQ23330.1 flavodoxin family protein [Fusobacterium nucleatum subsp. nucleatum ATCC 23726]EFG96213.1 hypothetical protein HMPREF0397_0170 [Fusobacterium nucleatum subsp. nucleatum ATCC 23726]MCG6843526.1 flavodoxin family protein [Fusobacterium nucleatum]
MEIIIHDLPEEKLKTIYGIIDNSLVITNNKKIKSCTGCFYCWTKNPGECRIKDGYDNLAELYSKVEKIIIISRCCYGSYSPFIKNVLDRSIPYLLPFFKIKNKEMHHTIRYKKNLYFELYFYGEDIADEEKEIAKNMVKANCINLNVTNFTVSFLETIS